MGAHEEGSSFEAVEGEYLLDLGYSGELLSGEPVVFDFNLRKEIGRVEVPFESVWVRLGSEKGVALSTRLHGSDKDKTILNYKFLESGDYTLLVRFVDKEKILAEHSFIFKVKEREASKRPIPVSLLVTVLMAFLFGALVSYLFSRGRQ